MNRMIKIAATVALALVGLLSAAARAEAQIGPIGPMIEYRTEGGRVLWNYRMQVYSTGFTVAVMQSPRGGEAIVLTDYVRPAEVAALRNALRRTNFHSIAPRVRTRAMIADLPDRVVRFEGKTVRFTTMGQPRDPVASVLFVAALDRLADHFARIAGEPLAGFDTRNGMLGRDTWLTVTRGAQARLRIHQTGERPFLKDAPVDFAKVNELKRRIAFAGFFFLPNQFVANPPPPFAGNVYDVTAYDVLDRAKTIHSQGGATEPRNFTAVWLYLDTIAADLRP